jgi:hypothetical protein
LIKNLFAFVNYPACPVIKAGTLSNETRKISHAKDMIPKDRANNFPKLKINLKEEN